MLSTLFNITVIAEWCAFITAVFLLRKKTKVWQLFIVFLFITVCAETAGWILSFVFKKNNNWIFNINLLINVPFSIWIFSKAEPLQKVSRFLYLAMALFIVFALTNLFFFQGFWKYNGITDVFSSIMLAVICCYFFYAVLKEETFRDLFRYEYFWLANGFLFYSLGSVVLYVFLDYLWAYYNQTKINVYGYINYGLNVLFYGSLIIAFICRHRNSK